MPDGLMVRVRLPEWMDEAGLDAGLHRQALRGLERINLVSRTLDAVWAPIAHLARRRSPQALTVIDVACGAGDLAIGLARRAARRGVPLSVEACDVSATALEHATGRAAQRGTTVRFFAHDVLAGALPATYDVVVCSLFLHHLELDDATRALRTLRDAARLLLVVTDLDRSRVGLALAWLGTRLLSRSPVVHVDGLRSVRAAFTPGEAVQLARDAGIAPFAVARHWPRRWRLVAERS
jgi:2-polyprenyl-3-methyl-5-hydroxy-6-metoxy-1,4-benzoquinol methylase